MKIIVTGGSGFIGSSLIREIIKRRGFEVLNIDKLSYASSNDSLLSIADSKRYTFKKVNICNLSAIKSIINKFKPNLIMHLAAESHVDRSIEDPGEFIHTNIVGTFNLLDASYSYYSKLSTSEKDKFRFHHISTDEVYGDLPHPDFSEDADKFLFKESTNYNPSSPYSASKASSDHLVRAWGKTYGLPFVITNCSNNYGPFQYPEKLIPVTILNAINYKPIPVYGAGNQIRDWLYVDDHVNALLSVAKNGRLGETYNIGAMNEQKNIDVVLNICEILDEFIDIDNKYSSFKDLITHIKDRPGHDNRYAIDSSKLVSELKWAPKETFDSGLKKTVKWYLDNLNWCENIQSAEANKENL